MILAYCSFTQCASIRADDSTVKNCRFRKLKEDLCAERTAVEDCIFEDIVCNYEALLCLADCLVTRCTFRDIHLSDESLLATAIDSGEVEHCSFSGIISESVNRELFYGRKLSGGIYKKRRIFDVVDTCTVLLDTYFI